MYSTALSGSLAKVSFAHVSRILHLRLSVSQEVVSFYMSTESKWPETLPISMASFPVKES